MTWGATPEMAYPLRWPIEKPRTPDGERKHALWRHEGRQLTMTPARERLRHQLRAITTGKTWRTRDCVLSTNIRYTGSGGRDQSVSRRDPADPGAALYFQLDHKPLVLACDRWTTVQDNIAAIAAHIEALRGQERWGVADLAQAFAGHVALPAPEQWWQVLGVRPDAPLVVIENAWRALIRDAHPDKTGSNAAAARLNAARDEGRKVAG